MGTPMGTPTPTGPSQPTGLASNSSGAPLAPTGDQGTALLAVPPGLAPPSAGSTDMEGVEDGSGDDEVVVVEQAGAATAGTAAHSRSFAD
eukprot:7764476-Alexandrium_andersonii.AAC.1